MKDERKSNMDKNRDPMTGEPGSHPVGTGVGAAVGGVGGAAAGAATGAAMGTAGAGPIGTGIGAVAGAVIGGAAGHGTAEGLNPTQSTTEGRFIDYAVVDRNEDKIGTVESVWLDHSSQPAYLSVRTGWLGMGRTHVIPAQRAEVSESRQQIRVPYTKEQIKDAPDYDSQAQLQSADEDRIGTYYGGHGFRREGWLENLKDRRAADRTDETHVQLKEEQLRVGKREVEAGGVRLRKVVRTETVNQPVELKREEIVVERVPGRGQAPTGEFREEEIYVPLRHEEAVIGKEAHVIEEVRIGKKSTTEQQNISDTVRKEDVEIEEDTTSESRMGTTGDRSRPKPYQPKERSRNT